jgi:hypothetical protein
VTAEPETVAKAFIEAINRGDLDGLIALMADGHAMRILDEPPVMGEAALRNAWRGYFEAFPEYAIYVEQMATKDRRVAILGSTTGSHLGLPDEEERQLPVLWTADVSNGRVASWNIIDDSPELRRELGLS